MDAPRDKGSKSERERQISYDVTDMWNLRYDTNEPIKQKQTHGHREQTCGSQGEQGELKAGSLRIANAKY